MPQVSAGKGCGRDPTGISCSQRAGRRRSAAGMSRHGNKSRAKAAALRSGRAAPAAAALPTEPRGSGELRGPRHEPRTGRTDGPRRALRERGGAGDGPAALPAGTGPAGAAGTGWPGWVPAGTDPGRYRGTRTCGRCAGHSSESPALQGVRDPSEHQEVRGDLSTLCPMFPF